MFDQGVFSLDYRATVLLYLELVLALGLLWREGLFKTTTQRAVVIIMVSMAFVFRYCVLTYETLDYQDWIKVWVESLRQSGAWAGLGSAIWSCNYNVPYLYFLAIFSKSDIYDLLLVKLLSILFDVILAWSTMRLVSVFTDSPARKLVAFIGVLWLPTVYLNGAYWGQCDVIYATFAVLSIYLMLSDRPIGSVICIAVSVSFKLQGIFLLPVYFVYLIARKVKLWHLLLFPVAYIVTILPAVIAGRGFWELLTLYINNTSTIGDGLNYNSSSLYALLDFSSMSTDGAARIGIILAFFLCAGMFVWLFIRYKDLDNKVLLGAAIVFCIGIPFLLPHMHDRYFFMADVLTFALAVIVPGLSITPILVSFGSFLGYYAYLKMRFLLPMRYGAVAMLIALLVTIGYTAYALYRTRHPKEGDTVDDSGEMIDDRPPKRVLTNAEDMV